MNNQQINIDLNKASKVKCECGSEHFVQAISLYKVSALLSPTGAEILVQQPVYICYECKKVIDAVK